MALVGGPPTPLYHCPRKRTFNVSWKVCLKQTQGSYVDPVCFRHFNIVIPLRFHRDSTDDKAIRV